MTIASVPLPDSLEVINVGLEVFADELAAQHVPVVHVEWQPPLGGAEAARSLETLLDEDTPQGSEASG